MAAALRKWKREREEHGNDPLQAPSPKRERELSPVAPPSAAVAESDEVTDAAPVSSLETGLRYVREVKATFKDDAGSYQKFVELLQDVRLKHVDYAGVGRRVTELFKDHRRLTLAFNMFLPDDHRITLPSTTTEPPEALVKRQGIVFRRKVDALGRSKYKEFWEILAGYKRKRNTIDHVYKLVETLFADHEDLLAEFRTFLPTLEASMSEIMTPQEPDQQQQALPPGEKVKSLHLNANVRESETPGKSSRRAEMARKGKEKLMETTNAMEVAEVARRGKEKIMETTNAMEVAEVARRGKEKIMETTNAMEVAEVARKGKEKIMETTNSKEVAWKLKERTINRKEEARTQLIEVRQPPRITAHNATRRQQVQTAPTNAAGSPRPASDHRVSARTAARRQLQDTNLPRAPPPPVPSIAELRERLKNVTECSPDCKACEHVEYPLFDWQAEDPEYYAKGKANRERERQALIASGLKGSFNDS